MLHPKTHAKLENMKRRGLIIDYELRGNTMYIKPVMPPQRINIEVTIKPFNNDKETH